MMPDLQQIFVWLQGGEARLVVVALLFLVMWLLKALPAVREKLLTTPRRKQIAAYFLMLPPALWMVVEGAPWVEVLATAVGIVLAANGLNTYRPSKSRPKFSLDVKRKMKKSLEAIRRKMEK